MQTDPLQTLGWRTGLTSIIPPWLYKAQVCLSLSLTFYFSNFEEPPSSSIYYFKGITSVIVKSIVEEVKVK